MFHNLNRKSPETQFLFILWQIYFILLSRYQTLLFKEVTDSKVENTQPLYFVKRSMSLKFWSFYSLIHLIIMLWWKKNTVVTCLCNQQWGSMVFKALISNYKWAFFFAKPIFLNCNICIDLHNFITFLETELYVWSLHAKRPRIQFTEWSNIVKSHNIQRMCCLSFTGKESQCDAIPVSTSQWNRGYQGRVTPARGLGNLQLATKTSDHSVFVTHTQVLN